MKKICKRIFGIALIGAMAMFGVFVGGNGADAASSTQTKNGYTIKLETDNNSYTKTATSIDLRATKVSGSGTVYYDMYYEYLSGGSWVYYLNNWQSGYFASASPWKPIAIKNSAGTYTARGVMEAYSCSAKTSSCYIGKFTTPNVTIYR